MNTSPMFAVVLFLALIGITAPASGQKKISCACEAAPGRTCHGSVSCPDGCTSLCGAGDTCYMSCWSNGFEPRITIKFVKKTGQEIASLLSAKTHKRIVFIPDPRNATAKYDLELKDDDVFNVLNYLFKRGRVIFDGADFSNIRNLRNQMKQGKRIAVNFNGPAKDAVAKLAFTSGRRLRITSGDPEKIVSISMHEATLDEILVRFWETAGIKIQK